jgi:hypothetical protein
MLGKYGRQRLARDHEIERMFQRLTVEFGMPPGTLVVTLESRKKD